MFPSNFRLVLANGRLLQSSASASSVAWNRAQELRRRSWRSQDSKMSIESTHVDDTNDKTLPEQWEIWLLSMSWEIIEKKFPVPFGVPISTAI